MKKIEGELWWKPFGTMLSCINAKDSKCHYGKTVEECEEICKKDARCQLGYHITLEKPYYKEEKRICVPINNSYQWYTTQILNSLISDTNETKLSTNKGIKFTGFYNEKKYKENSELPKDFDSYLFSGVRVNLCIRNENGKIYYLTDQLTFIDIPELAITLDMIIAESNEFDFKKRILKGSYFQFLKSNTYYLLTIQEEKFTWKASFKFSLETNNIFEIKCDNENERWEYFNEDQECLLKLNNIDNKYLQKDDENRLILGPKKKTIFFKIIKDNIYNKYFQGFFKTKKNEDNHYKDFFYESLNKFLCDKYPECKYKKELIVDKLPFIFAILFFVFLDIIILIIILMKKKL